MQTALAALAALLMTLSAVLTGTADARSLHSAAQHAFTGVMDDALVRPERPAWTRTQGECRDGDTLDVAAAAQPQAMDEVAIWRSAPPALVGFPSELTLLPLARGPPTPGT